MFNEYEADLTRDVPGPIHEVKERHLHDMKGLNERNFSFGERKDLSAPANDYPPAKYKIPGFCDRFGSIRKKLSPTKK